MKRHPDISGPVRNIKLGDLFRAKRKPILMASAAILVALAGLQLSKAFFNGDAEIAAIEPAPSAQQAEPGEVAEADAATMPSRRRKSRPCARPKLLLPARRQRRQRPRTASPIPSSPQRPSLQRPSLPRPSTLRSAAATAVDEETSAVAAAAPPVDEAPATTDAIATTANAGDAAAATAAPASDPVPVEAGPLPLREAAEAGDPKALFEVGSRYAEGRGTKADMKAAAKWYEKSAELGLAPAQYRIGNFYEKGLGVDRDIAKAKTWYQMAAEQGNASAMHNLAVLFAMGADGAADNEFGGAVVPEGGRARRQG